MGLLTRDQILAADDIKTERIAVPEWGGDVLLRGLTAKERGRAVKACTRMVGNKPDTDFGALQVQMISMSAIDEAGTRLFTDNDVQVLSGKHSGVIEKIFTVVAKLSGVAEDEIAEMRKNSESSPSDDSNSG